MQLDNNAEGGSNGTAVATTDTGSGAQWDVVTTGGTSTLTYSNAHAAHGQLSYDIKNAASFASLLEWSTQFGTLTQIWGRFYIYLTANPTNAVRLVQPFNATTSCGFINAGTTGKMSLADSTAATINTFTNALTLNAWNRVEFEFIFSATVGQIICSLYAGDSGTATETQTSVATLNTLAQATNLRYGITNAPAGSTELWMDDLNVNTTGFPGPAGALPGLAPELPIPFQARRRASLWMKGERLWTPKRRTLVTA